MMKWWMLKGPCYMALAMFVTFPIFLDFWTKTSWPWLVFTVVFGLLFSIPTFMPTRSSHEASE